MKRLYTKHFLFLLFLLYGPLRSGAQVPELMYYTFDEVGGSATNFAQSATALGTSATLGGALTQGGIGQFGGGLQGAALNASNIVNTNTPLALTGSWTISMWLSLPSSSTVRYFFGTSTAGSSTGFRCFTGGAAGVGGITLRGGTSMTNVTQSSGILDATGTPVVVTFVYDATIPAIILYKNGVFVSQTAQSASVTVSTGSNFLVLPTGSGGLNTGEAMDEFRLYNRALSATEVATTFGIPLPVKLSSFSARYQNKCGSLTWRSSDEKDLKAFVVERSLDGQEFKEIATVDPKGGASQETDYSFTDDQVSRFADNADVYYRLRMVDVSGKITHSKVAKITISSMGNDRISIAGNPFVSEVLVQTNFAEETKATIMLTDYHGRVLLRTDKTVGSGYQQTLVSELGHLTPGAYQLTMNYPGGNYVTKLLKQ